jgi:ABC-type dipeptide/oligopeptide/nickel transport system permease component
MASYTIRRLLGVLPTLWVIVTLTFFMMHAAPGGPFDSQRKLPPEVERNMKAAYNLDKPVYQQYLIYLDQLAHGDLGPSFKTKDFTVAQLIGIGLPVSGWNGGAFRNLILPVVTLSLLQIAVIARLVRGSMVEVLRANYIRTARAKGAPSHSIIYRHALRAAILPLVSYLAPATAGLLTGSLIVEEIFGLPGIGRYFVQAALNRDYTLMMGVVLCYATLVILLNFLADIVYALLDPRVRLT